MPSDREMTLLFSSYALQPFELKISHSPFGHFKSIIGINAYFAGATTAIHIA